MKELSIEQKAQRYDEAIKRAKELLEIGLKDTRDKRVVLSFFPELKESSDEEIRKAIHIYLDWIDGKKDYAPKGKYTIKDMIAWLEKQGEKIDAIENFDTEFEKQVSHLIASAINKEHEYNQGYVKWSANALLNYAKQELEKQGSKSIEGTFIDTDSVREDFMQEVYRILDGDRDNDRANQIIEAFDSLPTVELKQQGEQTPVVIIPKFRVGDEIKTTNEEPLTITKIDEKGYWSKDLLICSFGDAAKWELVEQKTAWSEEDERVLKATINTVLISRNSCEEDDDVKDKFDDELRWLKSLKERVQPQPRQKWKPTEEQMKQLGWIAEQNKDNIIGKELMTLYNDLKQL